MQHLQPSGQFEKSDKQMPEQLFRQYSDLVYEHCGINLHDGKRALLQARVNKRLRATGIGSFEQYFKIITSGDHLDEFVHFVDSISTNLTYFFREPQHFDFLEKVLLPELIERQKKQGNHRIRIWSAGCSTGEEPYTIAMSVLSQVEDHFPRDVRILATDISTRTLDVALKGTYSAEKIRNVPPQMRQRFFTKTADRKGAPLFEVVPELRQTVVFRRLNLFDSYPFKGPFDCIFCRNVMIYFDKKTQQALVNKMAEYLAPGGYLLVGHSESLTGLAHPLTYVRPATYKK
jgi:chemotaxis protein methyltransferase CheR